jgi:tRNA (cytidine32/uridine32-2'-O)-methyltransferase
MKLDKVRVVLMETTHPGNIGAAARAMKNMSLSRLYLVKPRLFPHDEATARASGATDLLENAVLCDSLDQALEGCGTVIGASARRRSIRWPEFDPRECAEFVDAQTQAGDVAIIFGRESSGLSNEELDRCGHLVHIPCNPDFSSLNIAAAIQVLCYELHMRVGQQQMATLESEDLPATMDELEGFYQHLEQTMVEIEFLDPDKPRKLMRRLRRLFNRSAVEKRELNILRGILTAAQIKARNSGADK